MSGRCTSTEALTLLAPELSPMAASQKLTRAINGEDCQAYCGGVAVEAHIAAIARVVPKRENDGRWTADIESTGPGLGWVRGLNWELEIDEVMALRPQPDTKGEAMQAAATAATTAAEAAAAEVATARAELEQARAALQAATEQMEKAEVRAQAAEARVEASPSGEQPLPRRKPGQRAKHPEWKVIVAREAIRCIRAGKQIPSAAKFATTCQKELGWEPDPKEIRLLLRELGVVE
jgi:hypothetical protein